MKSKGQYINGHWHKGKGPILQSFNPATATLVWEGQHASEEDIAKAHEAARHALQHWSQISFEERIPYIQAFGKTIEKNKEALAHCISEDSGKPLWESRLEVKSVLDKIPLSIQAYQERTWPKQTSMTDFNANLRFKAQGVVAVLGPFNFPAHLSNGHILPALLAGNTILYKPSEETPAVAEWMMQAWDDSMLPAGVINCLQGDASCGKALLSQKLNAVYFTGSYSTGLRIHQQFSNQPEVLLALEMGGNNSLIVDSVQNRKAALYNTLLSTMITTGQRCTCARRLFIPQSSEGDDFLKDFKFLCESVRIAAFNASPEPFMGPVISYDQAQKHVKAQAHLIDLGGKVILNMTSLAKHTGFLSPGLIDMTDVSIPFDDELFAPLVQIFRYQTFEEALEKANQSRYGLVAGLISDNEAHYRRFYQSTQAGLINWNRPTTGALSSLPFGGVGWSGNHRPSAYFAADYCAYPVASLEQSQLSFPKELLPGISL